MRFRYLILDISCIVLAGGKGQRLGRDKVGAIIDGQSLLRRVISSLEFFGGDIIVVIDAERDPSGLASYPRLRVATDVYPGKGPLVGIYSGLSVSHSDYNLVVACDMPFLNQAMLKFMVQEADGFDIVVPRLGDRPEPLHAVYGKGCLEAIEGMFRQGDYRVGHLLNMVKVRYLEAAEIDRFDPGHLSFFNINTEADMVKARDLAGKASQSDSLRSLSEQG